VIPSGDKKVFMANGTINLGNCRDGKCYNTSRTQNDMFRYCSVIPSGDKKAGLTIEVPEGMNVTVFGDPQWG
jgi:hypothetical protein